MSVTDQQSSERKALALTVEVSGCPSACMHCWAAGHAYAPMRTQDIDSILKGAARFCDSRDLKFEPWPMHEVLGHESALSILQMFKSYSPDAFEPLPTNGLALADRADWEDVLAGIADLGTKMLWFTFHGIGDTHDRIANSKEAFAKSTMTIRRARQAGLRCGANFYVTASNVDQILRSLELSKSLELDDICFEVAGYYPQPMLRKYETVRPTLRQLEQVADKISRSSRFFRDKWKGLDQCVEAYYVERAAAPEQSEAVTWTFFDPNRVSFVCRSNMDLHSGMAGLYGPLHGNVGDGAITIALQKGLDAGPHSAEQLHFPGADLPSVGELARKVGNPNGQKIHFEAQSMRRRWLDRMFNPKLTLET